jgi:hypothetical protein
MDPERSFIVMLGVFRVFFKLFFISTVLSALVKKMSFRFYERIFHRMDRWLLAVVGACLLLASSLVAQQQQQDEEGSGNGSVQSTSTSGTVIRLSGGCKNQFFLISDQLFESIGTQFRYTVREGEFD